MLVSVQLCAMARLLLIPELQKAVFVFIMLGQPSVYPTDSYWSFGPAGVKNSMRWWQWLGCSSLGAGRQSSRHRCSKTSSSLKMAVISKPLFKSTLQKMLHGKFSILWCWYSSSELHRWAQPCLDQGERECSSLVSVPVLKASSLGIWLNTPELPPNL